MRLNVTRKQVLEAIRTEPLRGGNWFHGRPNDFTGEWTRTKVKGLKNNTKCAVCAVGGILDCALGKKETPKDLAEFASDLVQFARIDGFVDDYNYDIEAGTKQGKKIRNSRDPKRLFEIATLASKGGKHLSGLSMLFEGLYVQKRFRRKGKMANKRLRNILIAFVKKNFPKRLVADENSSL